MAGARFQAVVVGGGITGAAVVRDLALRGVRTLLLEKEDFASGTTGQCMALLHGGPRYLLYDAKVTVESCRESGIVQSLAPHLTYRVPFVVPVYPGDKFSLRMFDAFFTEYDRHAHLKNSFPHRILSGEEALRVEPGLAPGLVGAVALDEWGVDVSRLNWLLVADARERGAVLLNHAEVTGFRKDGDRLAAVRYRRDGREAEVDADVVVNAAGPWVPRVAGLAGFEHRLKPTKGVQLAYDRPLSNVSISGQTPDGRTVEVVAHRGYTIVGRTDSFYDGDPADSLGTPEEVAGLVRDAARIFPRIRDARPHRTLAGVRPLLWSTGENEYRIPRDFAVTRDGANLVTLAGGKMVTARLMAQRAGDEVCRILGIDAPCATAGTPLVGAAPVLPPRRSVAARTPRDAVERSQAERHGASPPGGYDSTLVCPHEFVTEAEIRHAVRHEMCRSLEDLRRRLRLGAGPCGSGACGERAADVLADLLAWGSLRRRAELEAFRAAHARRVPPEVKA